MSRIIIQGIGGVGGLLAAHLIRAGEDVTLITGNAAITAAINDHGIGMTTPEESFHVDALAFTSLEELPTRARFEASYLAMMAGAVVDAARAVQAHLQSDGYFVAFQNGFVEDAIADAVGNERVVSATVALGSTMEAPGKYRRTTPGSLIIGEMDGRQSDRIAALQQTLSSVIETTVSTNIIGVLWGKLIWNGAVSGLCAVSGRELGALFDCACGRELFLQAFRESVTTARAQNVDIEPVIVDPKDYYYASTDTPQRRSQLLQSLLPFVTKYAGVTPSTLESLKRGRLCEIDFLNGYILDKARARGIDAPLNERLIPMVHEIEKGQRQIADANLQELAEALRLS